MTSKPPSKAGQGKWQGHRASGQTQLLKARLSGYANYARRDANTGMFAQINKFMTYLCKSCHFENPENIRHKMKRNILFRYSGNFSNIDQWYARTCPIIDIWPTNPSDRTTFETPSNHLRTNQYQLLEQSIPVSLIYVFDRNEANDRSVVPVICTAIKNFIWNMMQLKLSRCRWRPQTENGSKHNDSGIFGNYYHWDPKGFVL